MTRNELYELLRKCGWETTPIHTLDKIWGQPFDGVTEKIQSFAEKSLLYEEWLKQADLQLTENKLPPTPTQPQ